MKTLSLCPHGNQVGKCLTCRDEREVEIILAELNYQQIMKGKISQLSPEDIWNLCCSEWEKFLDACNVSIIHEDRPSRDYLHTRFYDRYASPKLSGDIRRCPKRLDE